MVIKFIEPRIQGLVSTPKGPIAWYAYGDPSAKSTILLGHGYLEHGQRNVTVINYLLAKGHSVIAWDLPGHGYSWGEPGAIDDFLSYGQALDAMAVLSRKITTATTITYLGHSTACAAYLAWYHDLYLTQEAKAPAFDTVILVAPLLRSWLHDLSGIGWALGRSWLKYLHPRTDASTHDPNYTRSFFSDPYTVKKMPVSWVGPFRSWERGTRSWGSQNHGPLVIIQGTKDTVLDWEYNMAWFTKTFPNVEIELIPGAWHSLFDELEPWRGQVYSLLDKHLE